MPPRHLMNPCSYLPRRLQIVSSLTTVVLFCILFLGTSSPSDYDAYAANVPFIGPQLQEGARHAVHGAHQVVDRLPSTGDALRGFNPFAQPAHTPPPIQPNSASGGARWYSDWSWRNPFSSSTTLDEDRAVLPPLKGRPLVYTYFDLTGHRTDDVSRQAEWDLLQIWRRAWWAQGFKPVVLGKPDAVKNPLYPTVQALGLEQSNNTELLSEMMQWLAWSHMGAGILAKWLAVPMAPWDDPLLSFLRQGEYPELTHYDGLDNGLFIGNRNDVEKALKAAIASEDVEEKRSIADAAPRGFFKTDERSESVAFYSHKTIASKYAAINTKLEDPTTRAEGLAMLPMLINSHLHNTWQNTFSSGIAVLKPLPQHSTILVMPAIDIARNLSECAESPMPASCPPNRPRCKPCASSTPMPLSLTTVFKNSSTLFTIGMIPHPYTMASLLKEEETMDAKFVRRQTSRDPWILATTRAVSAGIVSSYVRLPILKDAVASDFGTARSIWLTPETLPGSIFETTVNPKVEKTHVKDLESFRSDLDWALGFTFPRPPLHDGKSETHVSSPDHRSPAPRLDNGDGLKPSAKTLQQETYLIARSRAVLTKTAARRSAFVPGAAVLGGKSIIPGYANVKAAQKTRDVVEAWNLADTEMWKFVRAWNARRMVERRRWEDEEDAFLNGFRGGGGWTR